LSFLTTAATNILHRNLNLFLLKLTIILRAGLPWLLFLSFTMTDDVLAKII